MDELTLMRSFGAERTGADPEARAAAWQALSARVEAEEAAGRSFAATVTGTDVPPLTVASPPRLLTRRRRAVAFAGTTMLVALLAAILVFRSGPTAEPAGAAEVLRQTADVAASAPPARMAGPHQLLFRKTEQQELQEWNDEFTGTYGGIVLAKPTPTYGGQVRWREEAWLSNRRQGRDRLVLDSVSFLSAAERRRWKAAGSPLPGIFSGEVRPYKGERDIDVSRGVYDVETLDGAGYGQFADLPTEPAALRHAIERKQRGHGSAKAIDDGQVIAELWEILDKSNSTSALRAAVFGALAEEPGISLDRDAVDMVGRDGYALSYESKGGATEYQYPGVRVEYIFDPDTSAVLGKRETVGDAAALGSIRSRRIPSGTVVRDVAYLGYGVVDSPRRRPGPSPPRG